ncbi:MAG TPA: DUF2807 domain-containing protein [Rhizomicrobium sp.]|nr:DUF2807 domain-containing protein [Rhizomicrobium sp.]
MQRLAVALALTFFLAACCSPRDHQREDGAAAGPGGVVSVGEFDSVGLHGGGHVVLRYGPTESVRLLKGSTQYTRIRVEDAHSLEIDACENDCPLHYDLEVEVVMPRIAAVAVEGGGHIEAVSGFPSQDQLTAAVHGGGDIDLRAIDAANATAAVDGGGRIHIRANQHLTAAVNGGGSIGYSGNAEVTNAVNGGGDVHREDGAQ